MLNREEAHIMGKVTGGELLTVAKTREGILFAVVGELSRIAEQKRQMFMNSSNLRTADGISAAIEEQGTIKGLEFAINFIINLGDDQDESKSSISST